MKVSQKGMSRAPRNTTEVKLAAMRGYPDLPAGANLQAWLVTIAHRKAIDIVRAQKRHAIPVDDMPEQVSTIGIPGAIDHDLLDAVRELPHRQRQAVAYHYLAGLSRAAGELVIRLLADEPAEDVRLESSLVLRSSTRRLG